MHPGNWVAIKHAVVYYAQAAQAFNAGIKSRHCRCKARGGGHLGILGGAYVRYQN